MASIHPPGCSWGRVSHSAATRRRQGELGAVAPARCCCCMSGRSRASCASATRTGPSHSSRPAGAHSQRCHWCAALLRALLLGKRCQASSMHVPSSGSCRRQTLSQLCFPAPCAASVHGVCCHCDRCSGGCGCARRQAGGCCRMPLPPWFRKRQWGLHGGCGRPPLAGLPAPAVASKQNPHTPPLHPTLAPPQSLALTRLIQAADTVPLLAAELPQQCSISAVRFRAGLLAGPRPAPSFVARATRAPARPEPATQLAGRRREVSRLLRRGQEHGPHNRGLAVQV